MQINRDVCISVQNRVLRFENPELGKEKNIDTFLSFNHACLLIDTNRYNSGALMKKRKVDQHPSPYTTDKEPRLHQVQYFKYN